MLGLSVAGGGGVWWGTMLKRFKKCHSGAGLDQVVMSLKLFAFSSAKLDRPRSARNHRLLSESPKILVSTLTPNIVDDKGNKISSSNKKMKTRFL